jgi:hypothetical protein
MIHELYEQYLARVEPPALAPPAATIVVSTLFMDSDSEDEAWAATYGNRTTSIEKGRIQTRKLQASELERFMTDILDTSITTTENGRIVTKDMEPIRWWRERGENLYPTLAIMAYDLFAMPAMSSECERAFSSAKKLINEQRYSLKTNIIEADQCIKSWLKNGIANGHAIFSTIAAITDDKIIV